jgi:hypothetical protein
MQNPNKRPSWPFEIPRSDGNCAGAGFDIRQIMADEPTYYYHLSGAMLDPGAIILPGNWGRVLAFHQWQHQQAVREMALEDARKTRFSNCPSRLDAAFVFLTEQEARELRNRIPGFQAHLLYRVTLVNPQASSIVVDHRFCGPTGGLRSDWPNSYWSGVSHTQTTDREMLTLSPLRVDQLV